MSKPAVRILFSLSLACLLLGAKALDMQSLSLSLNGASR